MKIVEYVEKRSERKLLQQIFWECTLRCNLNCLHCGSDCRKDNMPKDMPFEDFSYVLDEVASVYDPSRILVVTTGGEPLVRKDIVECGQEITRKGFLWGMVSNGMMLNQTMLSKLVRAGLKSIAISLDGFETDHNWMRGNSNSFQRAVDAIDCLVKSNITWDVITCFNKRNYKSINEFMEFLIAHGVRHWRVFSVFPSGRAKDNEELQLTPEQFRTIMEFIKDVRRTKKIHLSYSCEGYLGSFEMKVRDHPFFCGAGINVASIRYDGAISGCLSIRSHFDQGNIYKDNFLDVWDNRFGKFRYREWVQKGECEKCNVLNICQGGSMHLRDEVGKMAGCSYLKLKGKSLK